MDIFSLGWEATAWQEFLIAKEAGGHASKSELNHLRRFIEAEKYLPLMQGLKNGNSFPLPKQVWLNKKGTVKKRLVFSFPQEENQILRFFGYQLHKYDHLFAPNLYSFIKGKSVKNAIALLVKSPRISQWYGIKLDIHDYFNSVDLTVLLPELRATLAGQGALFDFISQILLATDKGIMAGSPLSPFLADLYLQEMDWHFYNAGVTYARYADDIILFAPNQEELGGHYRWLVDFLAQKHLTLNPKKIERVTPGQPWTFLGFSFDNGRLDISPVALQKIKAKARRKAKAIYLWRQRKNCTADQAVRVFIRYFNHKLYDNPIKDELTWSRWYFPVINSTKRLRQIDHYMQECIRYVATGSHKKSAYKYRYEQLRQNGYRPLVAEYYLSR